jgi:hypothetical protein
VRSSRRAPPPAHARIHSVSMSKANSSGSEWREDNGCVCIHPKSKRRWSSAPSFSKTHLEFVPQGLVAGVLLRSRLVLRLLRLAIILNVVRVQDRVAVPALGQQNRGAQKAISGPHFQKTHARREIKKRPARSKSVEVCGASDDAGDANKFAWASLAPRKNVSTGSWKNGLCSIKDRALIAAAGAAQQREGRTESRRIIHPLPFPPPFLYLRSSHLFQCIILIFHWHTHGSRAPSAQ